MSPQPCSPRRPGLSPLQVSSPTAADSPAAFPHSHSASPAPRTSPGASLHGLGTSLHPVSSPTAAGLRARTCWAPRSGPASSPLARPCAAPARPLGQRPHSSLQGDSRLPNAAPQHFLSQHRLPERLHTRTHTLSSSPLSLPPSQPPTAAQSRTPAPRSRGPNKASAGEKVIRPDKRQDLRWVKVSSPADPWLLTRLPTIPPALARAHLVWGAARLPESGLGAATRPPFRPLAQSPWQRAQGGLGAVKAPEPPKGPGAARRQVLQPLHMGWGRDQTGAKAGVSGCSQH